MSSNTERSHYASEVFHLDPGSRVSLLGWVSVKNQIGGMLFMRIRDGSAYIQVSARKGSIDDTVWKEALSVETESAVYVEGVVKKDQRAPGGKEVAMTGFKLIAPSMPWPLRKSVLKSRSAIFDLRHLSIRGPKSSAVIRIRSELVKATFDYFYSRGYVYIQTPILVGAAVEGGATLFPVKYFDQTAYLSQSAQLYEEAAICSFDKVFVLQPAFRAEKSKTARHLTEFWMIESELAFKGLDQLMKVEEELVYNITSHIAGNCQKELEALGKRVKPVEPPFPKIDYDEALAIAEKGGVRVDWGEDLGTEAERLVSKAFEKPVFVKGYPLSARSFYHMEDPQRPKVSLSADLLAPEGYGEIATGGQRIHDYETLLKRIEEHQLNPESMKWYLELRRYGLPPHSGFGMGVERLLRWLLGLKHIRSTTLFPRTPNRLYP
ncbi:MAG: asparagine--tRNA ligase [Conexivisphaerales archaeon]